MNLNEYPEVVVQAAPGYNTFTAWLVQYFPAVDGRGDLAIVMYQWNGKLEFDVFPKKYVQETP